MMVKQLQWENAHRPQFGVQGYLQHRKLPISATSPINTSVVANPMRKACFAQACRFSTSWTRHYKPSEARAFRTTWGQLWYHSARAIHSKSDAKPDGLSSTQSTSEYKSSPWTDLKRVVKDPSSKHQIYVSPFQDPFKNLSIEHYLLQNTPPDSRVLFLYTNGPSVVIGRNQNPWLETNLAMAYVTMEGPAMKVKPTTYQLVRRRSGGGAVYHDMGNLNYSVISPATEFTRDKHAHMVASALISTGVKSARVNERHDIVVDSLVREGRRTYKVSGSAYKITRQRALHHGTLLLNSVLEDVSEYLNSPAPAYIKARGVESVKSPVTNLLSHMSMEHQQVVQFSTRLAIIEQFASLYGLTLPSLHDVGLPTNLQVGANWAIGKLSITWNDLVHHFPEVEQGAQELLTHEWKFDQTPQFIFSTHPTEEDPRERPPLPLHLPPSTRIYLKIKNSVIIDSKISFSADASVATAQRTRIHGRIVNQSLTALGDWRPYFADPRDAHAQVGEWLNQTLPSPKFLAEKLAKTK